SVLYATRKPQPGSGAIRVSLLWCGPSNAREHPGRITDERTLVFGTACIIGGEPRSMQRKSRSISRDFFTRLIHQVRRGLLRRIGPGGLAILLGTVVGCSSKPAPAPTREYEGVQVRVSCPGDPAAAVLSRYGRTWAAKTGARLEVVHYDPTSGPDA